MKRLKYLLLLIGLLFWISPVLADGDYKINNLNVDVEVDANGVVRVSEIINVDFKNPSTNFTWNIGNHYLHSRMVEGQGVLDAYVYPILSVSTPNYSYTLPETNNNDDLTPIIIYGKEFYGPEEIRINYAMELSKIKGDGDYLYLEVLPAISEEVETITFNISMPKIFDYLGVEFYVNDAKVSADEMGIITDLDGFSLVGYTNTTLEDYRRLCMRFNLGQNYFSWPEPFDFRLGIVIASLVVAFLAFIVAFFFGKNGLIRKTKLTYLPDGLNAASVNFVCHGHMQVRDIARLVIEWANRGYLQIGEVQDVDNLYLVKLKEMGNDTWKYERKLFNALFADADEVLLSDLKPEAISAAHYAQREIERIYTKNKANRIYTNSSLFIQIIWILLSIIPIFIGTYYAFYNYYFYVQIALAFGLSAYLAGILIEVFVYFMAKNYSHLRNVVRIPLLLLTIATCILGMLVYNSIFMSTIGTFEVCYSTMFCAGALVFVSLFMDKRTVMGKAWFGELLGLKEYMENASEEEVANYIKEIPTYFYDLLPYADALGVSDIWFKKFVKLNVSLPKWYFTEDDVTLALFEPRYYRIVDILRKRFMKFR